MTETVTRRDCPGGCSREIPGCLYACAECMKILSDDLRARLTSEHAVTRARAKGDAKITWSRIRGGVQ